MELISNKQKFNIIKCTRKEMELYYNSPGVCDSCNASSRYGYLVSVLNLWMCPNCYNEWIKQAVNHEEDKVYERRKFILFIEPFLVNKDMDHNIIYLYLLNNNIVAYVNDINDPYSWFVYLKYNGDRLVIAKKDNVIIVSKSREKVDICVPIMVKINDLKYHKDIKSTTDYHVIGNTVGVKCTRCEAQIFSSYKTDREIVYSCSCGKKMIYDL